MATPSHPQQLSPWLPDLNALDWQDRYRNGLAALWEAERGVQEVAAAYRTIQQQFEVGALPPEEIEWLAKEPGDDEAGDEIEMSYIAASPWTQVKESNLGMRDLHKWVNAGVLLEDADPGNFPISGLFTQINYRLEAAITSRIDLLLGHAERHFTLLLQQQEDVVALDHRARTRQVRAEWMRMAMLPLNNQPLYYPQSGQYRKVMDGALADLERAISMWNEVQQKRPSAPPLSRFMKVIVQQSLYDCCLRAYAIHWSERRWEASYQALSEAIALKPTVGLYLARAEICHRLGQFGVEASDCLAALILVGRHIPADQRPSFEAGLERLKQEMEQGNADRVIRQSLRFWRANPMMIKIA